MVIVFEFDYERIISFVRTKIAEVAGEEWSDVAQELARLGRWEFEDYDAL